MLRFFDRREAKCLLLFGIFAFSLIAIHKMFVFIVPSLACIIAAHLGYRFIKNNPHIIGQSVRTKIPWIYFSVLSVLFIIPFFFINYSWAINYFPIPGNTWYVYLLETLGFIGKRYGLIVILAGLGTFFILKNNFERRVHCIFLLIILLCIVPLFAQIMYAPEIMLTFFSIFAGFGILFIPLLLRTISNSEKNTIVVITTIISILIIFSLFTQIIKYQDTRDEGYGKYMYDETFYLTSFIQKETMGLPLSGSNGQINALLQQPNTRIMEIHSNDRQMAVSLKSFPTNLNELAAFIRKPFLTNISISLVPVTYAYEISLTKNDKKSIDTPGNMKIYSNGFEDLWDLGDG
jgi:hypothetical protein